MELDLLISILFGMFILALFLYLFRNVLTLLLGPAVGLLLYRCFLQKKPLHSHNLVLSFYMSTVQKMLKIVLLNLQ